jgi:hypothetical protein
MCSGPVISIRLQGIGEAIFPSKRPHERTQSGGALPVLKKISISALALAAVGFAGAASAQTHWPGQLSSYGVG